MIGTGKLAGALKNPLPGKVKVFDLKGKLTKSQQEYTTHGIDQAIKTVKGLNPAERMKWGANAANYVKEMEMRSGFKFKAQQKQHLVNALRTGKFEKLTGIDKTAHTNQFNRSMKNNLIRQWEQHTGQKWPKYQATHPKTGLVEPKDYQAHHIIPQQFGGPHQWWNMKPLHPSQHQGGIHASGSSLLKLEKIVKNNV